RARRAAADRQEPGLRERRDIARRRAVHARLLPARAGDSPGVTPPDRALPGDALAARLGRGPAAAAGAGRRARVLRRAAPSRRPRPRPAPRRADATHEGLLASPSPGLRAVARPRARRRGPPLLARRRVPEIAGRARSLPRHLPDLGPGRADVLGDARDRAAGALSPGIRRADVPGAVRRLPQVLGRSALAARGRAP